MKTIQAQIPDSIYRQAIELAQNEQMPLEQVVALALAQALGAWSNQNLIAQRAKRASRVKFTEALAQVPDVDPEPYDRL